MSQSVHRALLVLRALAERESTLDELADVVDVHKTTILRLLRTLEDERFVSKVDSRRYRLGTALFGLAQQALEARDVRGCARAALEQLNRDTGHTVHLAILESNSVVYVDKVDSTHPVRMYSRIGKSAPLHCTAVAKVLLAALSQAEREQIASTIDYQPMTPATITTSAGLLSELDRVAQQGHAFDHAEHEDFVNCVAYPVFGVDGQVVAALSMTVPIVLADFEQLQELSPLVETAAAAASIACGADRTGKENS